MHAFTVSVRSQGLQHTTLDLLFGGHLTEWGYPVLGSLNESAHRTRRMDRNTRQLFVLLRCRLHLSLLFSFYARVTDRKTTICAHSLEVKSDKVHRTVKSYVRGDHTKGLLKV